VDGDGDLDILSVDTAGDRVLWYANGGARPPAWTEHVVDTGAAGPITVAAGDVDVDGDTDVFSANFNDEGIAWYENRGALPWAKRVVSSFWVGAWGVHAADGDGDGDLDGIGGLTNTACGPPLVCVGVEWYENDGAAPPGFAIRAVSPGLVGASPVQAADVDADCGARSPICAPGRSRGRPASRTGPRPRRRELRVGDLGLRARGPGLPMRPVPGRSASRAAGRAGAALWYAAAPDPQGGRP
jgi:hypothetical protein